MKKTDNEQRIHLINTAIKLESNGKRMSFRSVFGNDLGGIELSPEILNDKREPLTVAYVRCGDVRVWVGHDGRVIRVENADVDEVNEILMAAILMHKQWIKRKLRNG